MIIAGHKDAPDEAEVGDDSKEDDIDTVVLQKMQSAPVTDPNRMLSIQEKEESGERD